MNCHANKSIECTVVSCANHCDEANYIAPWTRSWWVPTSAIPQ